MRNIWLTRNLMLSQRRNKFVKQRAEADLRSTKIRQKIGEFRSENGAESYVVTKSCFSTYKKNKINVFDAINSLLDNKPILI